MASEHGRNAANELAGQGLVPNRVNQVLEEAVGAAYAHVVEQGPKRLDGRLSESLAGKLGLDPFTTLGIVAVVTPFLATFLSHQVAN